MSDTSYDVKNDLLFLPLGGSGEIGMNLNLFCLDGKWMMVDLGITFAGEHYPGIDLILPDPKFIEERAKDLLAIVLTHGHEDHIGAVAHLWPQLKVPIYATKFTAELVRRKLAEKGLESAAPITIIEAGDVLDIGPFKVTYVPLAHSIAEGNALKIETRYGTIFHTGDWKLDDGPIIGEPTPGPELAKIGDAGVLAMVGDSTNVFNPNASGSESDVYDGLHKLVGEAKGRVVVTTFASNVARLSTIGSVARKHNRKLVAIGRSMKRIIEVARDCGYLPNFPTLLDEDDAASLPRRDLMIMCTGCQGEGRAALARIARGDHRSISLTAGDTVIFSSKIIPGNELSIGRLVNQLVKLDAEVITEKDAFVHVSGHPGQPELAEMYGWIKPRIAVPVHGEARHIARHAHFALDHGAEIALTPENGNIIRLAPGVPMVVDQASSGRLVLDGDFLLPVDSQIVGQRRRMAEAGHLGVMLVCDEDGELLADPRFVAQGIPGWSDDGPIADRLSAVIDNVIDRLDRKARNNDRAFEERVRIATRRALDSETGKRPVVGVRLVRLEDEEE